ncbi:hypothetical protein J5N97_027914 [Dioscorea zingiberensis]|uniref:TPX2 C-terminal domain-containing protein n=1 Tax=Dioscorea zingiberensis TaxID=325984 RepID=A0A9D5H4A9_9LILI|nr:hypothetical protein J5N97_027914 [Dioscorea zingiberensis]
MAGEIEDCLGIQAGSLHSGSISFGRFESESLSWERKSSFSHNRYLEEVEKCSTPGSVNQKKAYFEAHFKKKPLQDQLLVESKDGAQCPSEDSIQDATIEPVDHADVHQAQTGQDAILSHEKDSAVVVKQKNGKEHGVMEGFPEVDGLSQRSVSEKNSYPSSRKMKEISKISKVKATDQQKAAQTKVKAQLPPNPMPSKNSTEKNQPHSGKEFIKTLRKMRDELRTKSEEQPPMSVLPATVSGSKTPKSEDSGSLKGEARQENRRSKQDTGPAKTENKQRTAAFSFRSNERAEKRKEFSMKMEEKFRAKEAETIEILARTQEKTEAEIKQLRRSLNFKATPMPSFYHGTHPTRASDGKKMITQPNASTKLQSQYKNKTKNDSGLAQARA